MLCLPRSSLTGRLHLGLTFSFQVKAYLKIYIHLHFFERQTERGGRQGELLPAGSCLRCPQQSGVGQTVARSPDLNLGLPHGCLEAKDSWHYLLPPRATSAGSRNWEQSWDSSSGTGHGHPSGVLTARPNALIKVH